MYYPLLTSSFLLVVVLLLVRNRAFLCSLLPEGFRSRLPEWLTRSTDQGYTPLPLRGGARDWASQIRNGLTSSLFDIEANVANADARQGLDPVGVMDIQAIMAKYNVVCIAAFFFLCAKARDDRLTKRINPRFLAQLVNWCNLFHVLFLTINRASIKQG
ncbi:hypothetical protein BCV70DRAFT_202318 [Testicularia cyperi]|uniref:Uncharacterized protein n=1 Tax=Testicularia cyperi TaxID=1882483 RepID=A0A317XJW9_9BASI|nr:hypothetical protein BCV70DRAFT_202318 [Testicularia cyperi]